MNGQRLFLGLMTGTSLDGIDAALVDFSSTPPRLIAAQGTPLSDDLRGQLLALQSPQPNELHLAQLAANAHSDACADAIHALLAEAGYAASDIEAIGNHGQTIRHRPECGYTLQIGNHARLAEKTGISVVGDFRSRDVAAGGQGAPLVPAFHQALFASPEQRRALVNIGGIANISLLIPHQPTCGFDTGPGNVLMDLWISQHQGLRYDKDGAWAATGHVLPDLLAQCLQAPYFALKAPKSTGRDLFHQDWLSTQLAHRSDTPADVQATLCALSARSIADTLRDQQIDTLYVCGGGAHNQRLMRMLALELPQTKITTTEALGVAPDWMETYAFAWLAKCCIDRSPANLPEVTGAEGQRILGAIWPA
ncbi:anhydro-N-acetylmuramic acid kinase [Janthinobacterium sp. B9-8]|uniref:anhydro-N-acetylmuramic acid kinase n=1 Tax=Janthinobacterium sp. B9-8 TaxID=1236179 RepID=UPI000B007B82|nr:anhydro-N-acetylmuramic acid kinase [Janthinobacterium sp. B9-8]